jgi:EAL domain-containing protein (putative c-di-GMP-specific phosphodiesterase class I)
MLQTFPFDKIKIDRAFVKDLGSNQQSDAILKATCILAESLNIPVLAEGVETKAQLGLLQNLGVKETQGFYFGRPVDAETFRRQHIKASQDVRHQPHDDQSAPSEPVASLAAA